MLPAGLPTSVEHEVGHISYGARVVMDIPLWVDTEFKEHFTVIKPINLNADPLFRVILYLLIPRFPVYGLLICFNNPIFSQELRREEAFATHV